MALLLFSPWLALCGLAVPVLLLLACFDRRD